MIQLKLLLFGPPRFERDGQTVELRGRKIMALAAYLAVTRQSHSRDAIATLFWPEHDQAGARANLRRELSRLNKMLGEEQLLIDRESVGLSPEATLWLDVQQFQALLAQAQPDSESCAERLPFLTEAVTLYADDFLTGFTLPDSPDFDEWQFFQRESLRQQLAAALEQLIDCYSAQGEFKPAIAYARRWLALDPLHEPAHRALMHLYALADQRAAALRQYEECVRLLEEELGAAPEAETTALYERIQRREIEPRQKTRLEDLLKQGAVAAPPESGPPHNLPTFLTPLIGREAELTELAALLSQPTPRLVTILGPGGIGKSHLALEAATHQVDNFAHGVYFVPLGPLESVETMVAALANALGFSFYEGGSPQEQLLNYLRGKELLLLLDNFEHLLTGVDLVVTLLQQSPGLKILATSQVRLNVQGEQLFQLSGMTFPHETVEIPNEMTQYSAITLFIQSARRVLPDFAPTAEEMQVIARICRLVQGVPLGILLAAAWVELFTPAEIAAEIERSFDFLAIDFQDMPLRQRSIRAVFDSAWQLLTEAEQTIFAQLSIFRGGFTRQAAQTITGASLRELRGLTHKSLLYRTSAERYEIHGMLRQYAAERLAQRPSLADSLQERYGLYYAVALQQRTGRLRGGDQQAALAEIETDIENVRAAWNWAVTRGYSAVIEQAIDSLFHFFDMRSRFHEGAEMFGRAVGGLAEEPGSGEAEEQERLSAPHSNPLPEGERAITSPPAGVTEAGRIHHSPKSKILLGKVLARQGWFVFQLGQHEQVENLLQRSLEILRSLAETGQAEMPFALNYLGAVQRHLGKYDQARALVEESLVICEAVGDEFSLSIALNVLGQIAYTQGEYAEAKHFCRRSLSIARRLEHRWGLAFSLINLGQVALALEEYVEAKQLFEESLTIRRQLNDRRGIAICLNHLGDAAQAMAAYPEARARHEESLALFAEIGNQWGSTASLVKLGQVAGEAGDDEAARQYFSRALRLATEIQATPLMLDTLVGVATLWIKTAQSDRALEIVALIMGHPNSSRDHQNRAAHLLTALVEARLPTTVIATAQERAKGQALDAVVKEVLVELGDG